MSAFVEECRREWKRLGVPDLLAEEMATDLEADLAEAREDGVAAEEILGESDPRRFAAAWACERGLVPEQPPPARERRRRWPWVVGAIVLLWLLLAVAGVVLSMVGGGSSGPPRGSAAVLVAARVADLVGLKPAHASAVARRRGFAVHLERVRRHGAAPGTIVAQSPPSGATVPRGTTLTLRIARRR